MSPTTKFTSLLVMTVVLAPWILTLGIFIESRSSAVMSAPAVVNSANGRIEFRAYVGQGTVEYWGAPYVLHISKDAGPFPIFVAIEVVGDSEVSVSIDNVRISLEDGTSTEDSGIQSGDGSVERNGDFVTTRFSIRLNEALKNAMPFSLKLSGTAESSKSGIASPFEVSIDVPFERERLWYCGWAKVFYYDRF